MRKEFVIYKTGIEFSGDAFDDDDFMEIKRIFAEWQRLNERLKALGGRTLNVPDIVSEALFCYFFNAVRTNGTGYSFDCIGRINHLGIQLKSASIEEDLSSFGPTSTWDEIYYIDFAPNGIVDGNVFFYKLEMDFSNLILNASRNETFHDQQLQGRRPRFSIKKELIRRYGLEPLFCINLMAEE